MDGSSPIEAFLDGRLREDELLAEVDRVLVQGSIADRTVLLNDWRTKSGRIRASETRRKLDSKVQAFSWLMPEDAEPDSNWSSSEPVIPLQPGDLLANRFVIEARIGSGGMGTVFKARDLRREEAQDRNPYVAVKTLNVDVLRRADSLKILQREARKAQALSHPNIVRVYDFDRDGRLLFLTMELLEGASLEEILGRNGVQGASLASLLPILRQVVAALQFAHLEGIVHSDLKPANIIVLPDGRVKVIDFGISRAIPRPNQLTGDRTTFDIGALGAMTPAYASPEMIEGLDPDPRDDVFALACIVYEFLTGRHPFGRASATVARAGNFKPRRPANISSGQWRALESGLHFDRSERTSSPEQLLAKLTTRAPMPFPEYLSNPVLVTSALLVAATLIGLGIYFAGGTQTRSTLEADNRSQPNVGEPASAIGASDQSAAQAEAAQRKAAEDAGAAQRQTQQQAEESAAQKQAQQLADEEAAQRQAQPQAEEQAAQRQAQQQAAEEAAQRQPQQQADEAARRQAQQKAAEEASQKLPQPASDQIGPPQIAEAQRLLTSMGLSTGATDGRIGPRTQEMVRAYQSAVGQPSTGELTTSLLDSLRRTPPPAAARAKGLFTLAAEARSAGRPGDAARLYDAGLKLAPSDPDGLLALGDLRRDRRDFDGARRAYESLERGRGQTAGIARERLAGLPNQETTPNDARSQGPARASSGGSNTVSSAPIIRTPPSVETGMPFDGVYSGSQQVTGFSNPGCRSSIPLTVVVRGNKLSFSKDLTVPVGGDGSFSGYSSIGGTPPVAQHLTGRIQNGNIEAETTNPFCKYHIALRKTG
jgi:serine/threonine protein kinase